MSERLRELAARQAALRLRCSAERHSVGEAVRRIEQRLAPVNRLATFARNSLLRPGPVVVVIIALVTVGRVRGLKLLGRALLLTAALRRLYLALRML